MVQEAPVPRRGQIASWENARDVWTKVQDQSTFQIFEQLDVFSETFPESGSMRNGSLFERPIPARHTDDPESSSLPLLPTPVVREIGATLSVEEWVLKTLALWKAGTGAATLQPCEAIRFRMTRPELTTLARSKALFIDGKKSQVGARLLH